jgi:hypothetical protein
MVLVLSHGGVIPHRLYLEAVNNVLKRHGVAA